jgi:D-glycero-D-manno-heptose 1,7-bisphosphate phosphatase
MIQAAIFLDRDGTIIKDVGYIKNSTEVEFFLETFTALLKLQSHFLLFIITNQSGISKGLLLIKQ